MLWVCSGQESAPDMTHNWFIPQAYSLSFSLLAGCSFLTEVINMIFALSWCTFPCFHMLNSLLHPKRVSGERKWWKTVSSPTQKTLLLDLLLLKRESWWWYWKLSAPYGPFTLTSYVLICYFAGFISHISAYKWLCCCKCIRYQNT